MDSSTDRGFIRPQIVSPAGNPEKLRFAVRYGADNVYFGGNMFNLRVKSGNFDIDALKQGVDFCRLHGVTTTFLMNSFLHEADLGPALDYVRQIREINFDSVMISDPGMLMMLKEEGIDADFHLSTQMNTLNHRAVKFWLDAGFKRIVLGREVSVEEIRQIKKNTDAEIEVFAHGALCISYSGRCLLSRYLSGRDANQGDCSQPCRWKYSLVEEKRPGAYLDIVEHERATEIMSSKDLCLLERLEEYIDAGVDAFKIEGRIKSLYHAANTTRIYRHAVEKAGTDEFKKFMPFWKEELDLISHRPYTSDLFNEFDGLGFDGVPYISKSTFAAYKIDDGTAAEEIQVKTFNPLYKGEVLNAIFPIKESVVDGDFRILRIYHEDGETDMARPNGVYRICFDRPVMDNAIFRRINKEEN